MINKEYKVSEENEVLLSGENINQEKAVSLEEQVELSQTYRSVGAFCVSAVEPRNNSIHFHPSKGNSTIRSNSSLSTKESTQTSGRLTLPLHLSSASKKQKKDHQK